MAVLTATVTDSVGLTDTGTRRTIGIQVDDSTGLTDTGTRQNIGVTGTEPVGLRDTAVPVGGTAPKFNITVTDSVGLSDFGSKQDISETVTDSVGLQDAISVPTPNVPNPPPTPQPGAEIIVPIVTLPRVILQMAIGGTTPKDPAAGAFVLGQGQLGTGTLSALAWVDVTADLRSISTTPSPGGVTDTASPASMTVVLENVTGDYDPENVASPYDIDVGQHVRFRFDWEGAVYPQFYGYIDEITPDYGWDPTVTFVCTDGLAQLGRAKVRPQAAPVFTGDRTDQRVARILTEADWPATLRSLDKGLATCQGDTYGDFALPLTQRVVDSELGEHYVDGDGRYVFLNRTHVYTAARSTAVQALFTDSGDDIDMEGVTSTRARGELWNQASVTRDGGSEQFYEDVASRLKYGPQTFPRSAGTMLDSDASAAVLTRWIVARFKQPGQKVEQISIDATAQGMWDQILPLRRYDRIRLQRTYGTSAVLVDKQVLIEGIAWSVTSAPSLSLTITTRMVDNFKPFLLGTSKLGTGTLA